MGRRGGWRRAGRTRFRYLDNSGGRIDDRAKLERIEALVYPARLDRRLDLTERLARSSRPRASTGPAGGNTSTTPSIAPRGSGEEYERLVRFGEAAPGGSGDRGAARRGASL